VRQLLPEVQADVEPAGVYAEDRRPPIGPRPWVLINMIASADGGTAVEGRSGALGGAADKAVFRAVRAVADIILVAAGTVRAERYRAPALGAELVAARRGRGQSDQPRLAIVSRQLDLDASLPVFDAGGPRPIVVTTTNADEDRRSALAERAEVMARGEGSVDLVAALVALRDRYGAGIVLAEGGPSLNGALAEAGLVDELCLTVAPTIVGGASGRIVHGARPALTPLVLARVLEEDGYLFLRYVHTLTP
jgi:riboflavin-specific deaminase-like protein